MNDRIKEALLKLDVGNADHWTGAGLPAVGAVSELLGEAVSRQEISNAWPGYDRDAAIAAQTPSEDDGESAPPPAPTPMVDEQTAEEAAAVIPDEEAIAHDGEAEEDAIALLERACIAAGSPRFRRNYDLHAIVRQYNIQQAPIKESQRRLDARDQVRAERRGK